MTDFKRLEVWRKAHALALNVHRIVSRIRGRDSVALRSQLLRAAMSVPANIVEGTSRGSDPDFARFVRISLGSTSELEYHLIIARDCAVITKSDFDSLTSQTILIRKMLYALLRRLMDPKTPPVKLHSSEPTATN